MGSILLPCIYCGTREAEPGEHTLPAALGRFPVFTDRKRILCKSSPRDCIRGCNEEITGPACDRLFRRGALSLYRQHLPFAVGRSGRRGSRSAGPRYERPFVELAPGVRAPLDVGQGGKGTRLAVALVLANEVGDTAVWPLPASVVDGATLREALTNSGRGGLRPVGMIDDEDGSVRRIVAEVFPSVRFHQAPAKGVGGRLTGELDWLIGVEERRAVAMVAFHMFLALASVSGGEPRFNRIRSVIRGRLAPDDVALVAPPGGKAPYEFEDQIPGRQKHLVLMAPAANGRYYCDLRLFAAQTTQTPWWRVLLCEDAAPTSSKFFVALTYFSDSPRTAGGRVLDGEVLALTGSGSRLALRGDAPSLSDGGIVVPRLE